MTKRNGAFDSLRGNYLFQEIKQRVTLFKQKKPEAELISLGVGDTTQPLTPHVVKALMKGAEKLGNKETYTGYGSERGERPLREKINQRLYKGNLDPDEIYISDGCKCDIGRWQTLFGREVTVAVQDPAYPVYVDGSLLQGVPSIQYLPCTRENHFFPDFKAMKRSDLIYICSPNNPTGAVATHAMLEELVFMAKKNHSLILFDAAYSEFIQDPSLPKSIYEIPGARSVAIEMSSFSKLAGFTGLRLGWSVVPKELKYEGGEFVSSDWDRVVSTIFNGASNLIQKGGEAVLDETGWPETRDVIAYYLKNATLLKSTLEKKGFEVYGGVNAPYLWVYFEGKTSWEMFDIFLEEHELITTPGSGFGPSGEGYLRLSALNHFSAISLARQRLL